MKREPLDERRRTDCVRGAEDQAQRSGQWQNRLSVDAVVGEKRRGLRADRRFENSCRDGWRTKLA